MAKGRLSAPAGISTTAALVRCGLIVVLVACGNAGTGTETGTGGKSPASGGSASVGGNPGSGGLSAAGGATTGSGGRSAATGGTTTGSGGATTGRGGATTATGGNTSATGGAATGGAATGGATTGRGGTTTGTGGATVTGGITSARGGATTGTGGATTGTGGVTAATGGTTARGGVTGQGGTTTSAGGSGAGGSTSVVANAIYVAPNGSASAAGTLDSPTTLANAASKVSAGGTIYLRGGTYDLSSSISLSKSGSDASRINLRAYPLDATRPVLDFAQQATGSRGLSLSGSYWHVYGFDIVNAGDNCMYVSGSNNTLEFLSFSQCEDSGLQIGNGAANNLVLNCDSFFNADASLENADGFAAKLDVGSGNKFVGCRAWNNLDDGWDGYLRGADNVSTSYESCWAIDNGKLKDGSVGAGDGNGFKSGGSDDKALKHNATYVRCIAAGNVHDGFDHNSNRGSVVIRNSAAHSNGSNINFSATNIAASLTIKNTISLGTNGELNATAKDITNNSWQNGLSATSADFASVDTAQLKAKRKSDGSLPDIDYFKLVAGSDLRNAGVDIGLPFAGSAPDLGPFESAE